MNRLAEKNESLWWLVVAPSIWAAHLLICYVALAIWCVKVVSREGSLGGIRTALGALTVVALIGVGLCARRAWRHHTFGDSTPPHSGDTAADRHRFLGFANVLLSALSAVAIVYVGMTLFFFGSCR